MIGVLSLRELMAGRPQETVEDLMRREVERISVLAGREAVLAHPAWRRFHSLPVVDRNDVLVGVLTYAALRSLAGETEEQEAKGAALALAMGELYWTGASRVRVEFLRMFRVPSAAPGRQGEES